MKKQIAVLLSACILASCIPGASAAESAVETLRKAMKARQTEVTFKSDDPAETMRQVFEKEPELFYFFDGYEGVKSGNGKKYTIQISYTHESVKPENVFVVKDAAQLHEVLGFALLNTMSEVPMVITDSAITEGDIVDSLDDWETDYYLAYMGLDGSSAKLKTVDLSTWTGCTMTLDYCEDAETVTSWREQTEQEVRKLCGELFALDMPDYQKELLIHDYLAEHCTQVETAETPSESTVYGCLIEGKADSRGYAQAAKLLFEAAGLQSYYVEGTGVTEGRAWNCVKIGEQFYWVDVAMDDPIPAEDEKEKVIHKYFNLTDSGFLTDHNWTSADYPTCVSTTWNYEAVSDAMEQAEQDGTEYEEYSAKNVTGMRSKLSDLCYSLGIDESQLTAQLADGMGQTEEVSEPSAELSDGGNDTQQKEPQEESHTGRKFVIGAVVFLILLGGGYLAYQRAMYRRMLAQRRSRKRRSGTKRGTKKGKTGTAAARRRSAGTARSAPKSRPAGKKKTTTASAPRKKVRPASTSAGSGRKRAGDDSSRKRPDSRTYGSSERRTRGNGGANRRRRENPFRT